MNPTTRVMPMRLAMASGWVTTAILSGCASSLSGVGSTESYACKAPIGAQCTSVSGVYANSGPVGHRAVVEALRLQQGLLTTASVPAPIRNTPSSATPGASTAPASGVSASAAKSTTPDALRSPPRVMRLWIAPWEDADGDLHDASSIHVVVNTGRWLIERVRPAPRSRLDIATPPVAPSIAPSAAPAPEAKSPTDFTPTEP